MIHSPSGRTRAHPVLVAGLFALLAGCHDHSALEKQLADLRKELDQLRTVQGNAGVLLEDLDNRVLLIHDQVDSHRLMLGGAIPSPALPVVKLAPPPTGPVYPESVLPRQPLPEAGIRAPESFAAGGPATTDGPIHYQLLDEYGNLSDTGTGEGLPPVAAREAFREAAPATAPESPRREVDTRPLTLYKKGMALLQEKRHREAVAMFEDFLAQYPTHDYADNCLYWIGEAHYDRQMYHKALAAFEQVVAQHPRGNKVPDAMLKAAFCYHSLGMKDRAMELFEQLIRTWPGTPAARLAEERKTELL